MVFSVQNPEKQEGWIINTVKNHIPKHLILSEKSNSEYISPYPLHLPQGKIAKTLKNIYLSNNTDAKTHLMSYSSEVN